MPHSDHSMLQDASAGVNGVFMQLLLDTWMRDHKSGLAYRHCDKRLTATLVIHSIRAESFAEDGCPHEHCHAGPASGVRHGTSGWADSMSHAADISSRLSQQVNETATSVPQPEQAPSAAQSESEEAGLQKLQQLLQNSPEPEQDASHPEPFADPGFGTQQQQPQSFSRPSELGSRSESSLRQRDNRSLPKWLQPSMKDLEQAASIPQSQQAARASQMQSDEQLQEQLQQRLRSSGAELDGSGTDASMQAGSPEQASSQPLNAEDKVTRDAAFQRMQASILACIIHAMSNMRAEVSPTQVCASSICS